MSQNLKNINRKPLFIKLSEDAPFQKEETSEGEDVPVFPTRVMHQVSVVFELEQGTFEKFDALTRNKLMSMKQMMEDLVIKELARQDALSEEEKSGSIWHTDEYQRKIKLD